MWPFTKKNRARRVNTVTIVRAHTMTSSYYGLRGMIRSDFIIILGNQVEQPYKSREERVSDIESYGFIIDSVKIYPVRQSFYLLKQLN